VSAFADFALLAAIPSYGGAEILRAQRILPSGAGPRVHLALFGRSNEVARRVVAVAEAAANVDHVAVARIFEVGRYDGVVYGVADPAEGVDVSSLLVAEKTRRRTLPLDLVLAVGASVGQVLLALHESGDPWADDGAATSIEAVFPGGVRPDVLFLEPGGAVRMRLLAAAASDPRVASPFRAPDATPSQASDVYSLGRLLLALVATDPTGVESPRLAAEHPFARLLPRMLEARAEDRPGLHDVVERLEALLQQSARASATSVVRAALAGPYRGMVVDAASGFLPAPHVIDDVRMRLSAIYDTVFRLYPAPPAAAPTAALPPHVSEEEDGPVFTDGRLAVRRQRVKTASTVLIGDVELPAVGRGPRTSPTLLIGDAVAAAAALPPPPPDDEPEATQMLDTSTLGPAPVPLPPTPPKAPSTWTPSTPSAPRPPPPPPRSATVSKPPPPPTLPPTPKPATDSVFVTRPADPPTVPGRIRSKPGIDLLDAVAADLVAVTEPPRARTARIPADVDVNAPTRLPAVGSAPAPELSNEGLALETAAGAPPAFSAPLGGAPTGVFATPSELGEPELIDDGGAFQMIGEEGRTFDGDDNPFAQSTRMIPAQALQAALPTDDGGAVHDDGFAGVDVDEDAFAADGEPATELFSAGRVEELLRLRNDSHDDDHHSTSEPRTEVGPAPLLSEDPGEADDSALTAPKRTTLVVEAPEGAAVSINGTAVGTGRVVVDVDAGARALVKVTAPGFSPWSSVVNVEGQPKLRVRPRLVPRPR
jgi:hypothetical protein